MAPRRKRQTPPLGEDGQPLAVEEVGDSSAAFAIDPDLDDTLPNALETLESVTRDTTTTITTTTPGVSHNTATTSQPTGNAQATSSGVEGQLTAEESNRLSDFAQHVLGGKGEGEGNHGFADHHARTRQLEDPEADYGTFDAEPDGGLFAPAPEQGFTELLDKHHEQEREREREQQQQGRDGYSGPEGHGHGHASGQEGQMQGEGEGTFEAEAAEGQQQHQHAGMLGEGPPPPPPERTRRANKRRREDEPGGAPAPSSRELGSVGMQGDTSANGAVDPLRMKKDSHVRGAPCSRLRRARADGQKEVERRRRENINVGIDELALLLPDSSTNSKEGKSVILKRASTHMAELTRTVNHLRAEQTQSDQSRLDLQTQLESLQNELNEERSRSMRFERSWQQAEDRAASSQFELARANAELDKLRQGQGQGQGQ